MKKIYTYLIILAAAILSSSCNNEWEDEQYMQFVSFKAPIQEDGEGVTNIYVRYKEGGKVNYKLPVIVSGTTVNKQDRNVHVALDLDTLNTLNWERFSTRKELYYEPLGSDKYEFPGTVHISSGSNVEQLEIDFKLEGIDMVKKWVLPLTIVDDGSYDYQRHPRKNYAKALLRVIPFNDYSGSYNTSTMKVFLKNEDGSLDKNAMTTNARTGFVTDNNTIFFYAGLIGEELEEDVRKVYKVMVRFNEEDETLDLSAADPTNAMKFKVIGTPVFSSTVIMDPTRPYLKRRYVQLMVEYDFQDVTSGSVAIPYRVEGTMMLQRNYNTQIPDEDQQIEW